MAGCTVFMAGLVYEYDSLDGIAYSCLGIHCAWELIITPAQEAA